MVNSSFASILLSCRNLSKPIAVQSKEKEDRYVDNYRVMPVGICVFLSVLDAQIRTPSTCVCVYCVVPRGGVQEGHS